MTQKKTIPKKAPKCVQHVKRVERVERSSAKKRTRSPSNEEEESDERSTKDRRTKCTQRVEHVERSSQIPHEKLRYRSERRQLKGRFSFRSVDFFTNILLIEIMIANQNQ